MDFTHLFDNLNAWDAAAVVLGAGITLIGTRIKARVTQESTLYTRLTAVELRLDHCEAQHADCQTKLAAMASRLRMVGGNMIVDIPPVQP